MSDWEASEDEVAAARSSIAKRPVKKWEGEDEDESEPASDWEDSSSEEEEQPKVTSVAPPKKKGTLKAKLAEKEAAKAARAAAGDDVEYDEDAVLDPRERARLDREKEIKADLDNTAALFGAAGLGGSSSKELDALLSFEPRTKEDFHTLSSKIMEVIIGRLQNKPLYPAFVEYHARQLAEPLKDTEIRKAASALTTLANEKQKEQREKASGKKKPKTVAKPALGSVKASHKFDTAVYDEALDDFGNNADDFM
ncbi:translation initiation factor eIF3 subunit [Pisolithus microcarpus]|nr:translation initiation factor eIF3 subunit [Pisolithus microcarpus]